MATELGIRYFEESDIEILNTAKQNKKDYNYFSFHLLLRVSDEGMSPNPSLGGDHPTGKKKREKERVLEVVVRCWRGAKWESPG